MAVPQASNLLIGVRFSYPAPIIRGLSMPYIELNDTILNVNEEEGVVSFDRGSYSLQEISISDIIAAAEALKALGYSY